MPAIWDDPDALQTQVNAFDVRAGADGPVIVWMNVTGVIVAGPEILTSDLFDVPAMKAFGGWLDGLRTKYPIPYALGAGAAGGAAAFFTAVPSKDVAAAISARISQLWACGQQG